MGLDYAKLEKVFISGGFGVSLDIESAVHIGLLPDIDRRKFIFMGNSSLMGAKEALFSSKALDEMEDIARKATYFDLSGEKGYMDEYVSALFFPHTDLTKFPSLRG